MEEPCNIFVAPGRAIIPLFPGPDLASRAGVQWVSVPKHYNNNSLLQASRARAGQHSNCGAKRS